MVKLSHHMFTNDHIEELQYLQQSYPMLDWKYIRQCKQPIDQVRRGYAYALLHDALEKEEIVSYTIERENNGKPYINCEHKLYFNLSHSGHCVMCAISDGPIGIDLQQIVHNGKVLQIANRFFAKEDIALLENTNEEHENEAFTRIWSQKESYLKYLGTGLGKGLHTFFIDTDTSEVIDNGKNTGVFVQTEQMGTYWYSVCSK